MINFLKCKFGLHKLVPLHCVCESLFVSEVEIVEE